MWCFPDSCRTRQACLPWETHWWWHCHTHRQCQTGAPPPPRAWHGWDPGLVCAGYGICRHGHVSIHLKIKTVVFRIFYHFHRINIYLCCQGASTAPHSPPGLTCQWWAPCKIRNRNNWRWDHNPPRLSWSSSMTRWIACCHCESSRRGKNYPRPRG